MCHSAERGHWVVFMEASLIVCTILPFWFFKFYNQISPLAWGDGIQRLIPCDLLQCGISVASCSEPFQDPHHMCYWSWKVHRYSGFIRACRTAEQGGNYIDGLLPPSLSWHLIDCCRCTEEFIEVIWWVIVKVVLNFTWKLIRQQGEVITFSFNQFRTLWEPLMCLEDSYDSNVSYSIWKESVDPPAKYCAQIALQYFWHLYGLYVS